MAKYREFRGIDYETNNWVYGGFCDYNGYSVIFPVCDQLPFGFIGKNVIPKSVGQNTGLTITSENRHVFEGDIIKCRHTWIPKSTIFSTTPETAEEEYKLFLSQKIKYAYGKERKELCYPFYEFAYYRNYVVERDVETGGWRMRNKDVFHPLTHSVIYNRNATIIGNIFENKELLNSWKDDANGN